MPIVICSYCEYIGQQKKGRFLDIDQMWEDVMEHEKTCPEKTD